MNERLKQWLPWILVGVLGLILVGVFVANLDGDDSEALATTTTGVDTTSTAAPTTTTIPESTTTSTAPDLTTTTAPVETTTTSVPPETTTTAADPGIVELNDEGVQAGDEWVYFGYDDDEAIDAVTAVLGAPDTDSGWVDAFSVYGTCPGPDVRGVHWGDFVMLFTHADTDFWTGGVPHFFAYYYTVIPPDLLTTEGVGIGSSVEMLEAAYGGPLYTMDEAFFDPSLGFWTFDQQMWTGLWGYATGQSAAHVVTSINGGQGCGE